MLIFLLLSLLSLHSELSNVGVAVMFVSLATSFGNAVPAASVQQQWWVQMTAMGKNTAGTGAVAHVMVHMQQ